MAQQTEIITTTGTSGNGKDRKRSLPELLKAMAPAIATALPKHVNPDRMGRIALTALRSNPKLQRCEPASFLGCIIQAAQLGLEVNTPLGQAYLIPFEDRKRGITVCQLIVGYQGFMDLARRSDMIRSIYAFPVYEGDEFSYEYGLEPTIKHVPKLDDHDPKKLTHVYAVVKLKSGDPIFTVLSRADVERYRARSRASDSGPWVTDYEAMSLKTAVRRVFRWCPKSAEMGTAAAVDEAVETGRSQLGAGDPNVVEMLQANDIEIPELEEGEPEPPTPPEAEGKRMRLGKSKTTPASEPANKAPEREPGED